jgi:hypothetical protein
MGWSGWKRTGFGPSNFRADAAPAAVGDDGTLHVVCQEYRDPYSGDMYGDAYLGNDYWGGEHDIAKPHGKGIFGSPALTAWTGHDRQDLFVNAATGLLHRSKQRPHSWSDWEDLGGGPPGGPLLGSSPAACIDAQGQLDVFCISATDLSLLHKQYRNGWSEWESLGGHFRKLLTPAAQTWGGGRVGVFVVGDDYGIYHKWTAGGDAGWSGWEPMGGVTEAGVAACAWAPGRIDIFHRGQDRAVYHRWFDGEWSGWKNIGGTTDHGIAAASRGPGRIDVLHVGTDRYLYISELS